MHSIPAELTRLNQWHCWKNVDETKIPVQVTGDNAKSNDRWTWSSFANAIEATPRFDGLAFEITEPYCGIDLDNCIDGNGELRDWAKPIVDRLSPVAYGEISPSGNGIKFLTRARKPEGCRSVYKVAGNKQQIECYDNRRFWAITGDVWGQASEISDGQDVIDWLADEYLTPIAPAPYQPPSQLIAGSSLEVRARAYTDNADPAQSGDRNNAAFRLAGHLSGLDDLGSRLTESQVLELVRLWNSRNPEPLPDNEIESVVSSSRRNGTPREIKGPQIRVHNHDVDPDIDLSRLIASLCGSEAFPEECVEVPGLIGDVTRHNLATAHYPLPELALAGALSLMSTITGGKATGMRCRTNLYVAGLSPSGGGKDHSRKLNRKILLQAGHADLCGPERIGSHAGIVSALSENWLTLFQIDEIGRLLATMHSAQMAPHLYNIASVLMQVYSSADDIWQADAYGDRKKVRTLHYPHCVVYGSSVPDGFWESLTKQNLSDGLIGRFLIFENPEYVDYQIPDDAEIPASIICRVQAWRELKTHEGNLSGQTSHDGAHPRSLDATEAAAERLHQHAIQISQKRKKEDPVEAAIWSRHAEKTNKLALLFACSRWDPESGIWPTIGIDDADRAVRLNNWLTRRMLERSGAYVSENQVERDRLRVLRKIRERPEWSLSDLTHKTRWLRARDRSEILTDLIETGEIVVNAKESGGRPATLVRAT